MSISQDEVRSLIDKKEENKNVDYKEKLNWISGNMDEKLGIIKDILAMSNTQDGGKIIFGIRDKDFILVGMSDDDFNSFDQTKVNDLLQKYTDPEFTCQVSKYDIEGVGKIVVIDVPEFKEVPIICKKGANSTDDSRKIILKKGQIYIRTDKATSEIISSYQEMRKFIQRAIIKKSDDILRDMKSLLSGEKETGKVKDNKPYDKRVKETEEFFKSKLNSNLKNFGAWEVLSYPVKYEDSRLKSQTEVKKIVQDSEVDLRGWNFPHTDRENISNIMNGFQSYTEWEQYLEGYRAYQNGLFMWKRIMSEDTEGKSREGGGSVLSFISAIWSITEILIFLSRFYEQVLPDGIIRIEIKLTGLTNRGLIALSPGYDLRDNYIASEDIFYFTKEIDTTSLRVSRQEITVDIVRKLFLIFNWDASEIMIKDWIEKLENRTY